MTAAVATNTSARDMEELLSKAGYPKSWAVLVVLDDSPQASKQATWSSLDFSTGPAGRQAYIVMNHLSGKSQLGPQSASLAFR